MKEIYYFKKPLPRYLFFFIFLTRTILFEMINLEIKQFDKLCKNTTKTLEIEQKYLVLNRTLY